MGPGPAIDPRVRPQPRSESILHAKEGRILVDMLHLLNPVPIRLIHDRWIDKYTERRVSALTELKKELVEGTA